MGVRELVWGADTPALEVEAPVSKLDALILDREVPISEMVMGLEAESHR